MNNVEFLNQINFKITQLHSLITEDETHNDDKTSWLKEISTLMTDLVNSVDFYFRKNQVEKKIQISILVYFMHLHSTLKLFFKTIIDEESSNSIFLKEARNFCSSCLKHTMESLKGTFTDVKNYEDSSGNFIKWMDFGLEKLSGIDTANKNQNLEEIYEIIEEVLCHAMTIAQIALENDCIIIEGHAKAVRINVLEALQNLKNELKKDIVDVAMCKLLLDLCTDELCDLERKVNETVLRLCLEIFSNLSQPLKNLEEDPTGVEKFDLHVDRLIQVGLFAIACSTDAEYVVPLKANLANLEALESYLVPSVLLVNKKTNLENTKCVQLFKNYWLKSARALKTLIYFIIEPSTFSNVVHNEIRKIILMLEDNTDILDKKLIQIIISHCKVLKEMIQVTLDEFPKQNYDDFVLKFKNFKDVILEVESAAEELLSDDNLSTDSSLIKDNRKRILKRCKILLNLIKKIWYSYLEEPGEENAKKSLLKQSILITNENKEIGEEYLKNIKNKSTKLLKERSIIYKTPQKSTINLNNLTYMTVSRKKNLPFKTKIITNDELFINDTLQNLKNFS